jgi:hypothetical protein
MQDELQHKLQELQQEAALVRRSLQAAGPPWQQVLCRCSQQCMQAAAC